MPPLRGLGPRLPHEWGGLFWVDRVDLGCASIVESEDVRRVLRRTGVGGASLVIQGLRSPSVCFTPGYTRLAPSRGSGMG